MSKIWSMSDVLPGFEYCLALIEDEAGRRRFLLCKEDDVDEIRNRSDFVAMTQSVSRDLLQRGDLLSIAEQTKLESGETFYCTAHGIWLTNAEWEAIQAGVAVKWCRGRPPASL